MSTRTVDPGGGGDFTSMTAAEADIGAGTFTENEIIQVISQTLITDATTYAGYTPTVAFRLIIEASASASWLDVRDLVNDAFRFNTGTGNGAAVKSTGQFATCTDIDVPHTTLRKMQFSDANTSNRSAVNARTVTDDVIIEDCIIVGQDDVLPLAGEDMVISSSLIYQKNNGGTQLIDCGNAGNTTFDHCTVAALGTTTNGIQGFTGSDVQMNDSASFGAGTAAFTTTGTEGGDFNASDDTTTPGGNSLDSLTFTNQYENISAGTEDFRVKSGADIEDAASDGEDIGVFFAAAPTATRRTNLALLGAGS